MDRFAVAAGLRRRRSALLKLLAAVLLVYCMATFSNRSLKQAWYRNPGFTIDSQYGFFLLHGKPFRILSGSVHYFRSLPESWQQRLADARATGLNTIDTFVEWSSHEPEEGVFNFSGQHDIVRFLKTAHSMGLYVILRPGPYIGAGRDMGGLPYWLLRKDSTIPLRSMDTRYITFADRYLVELFKHIKPLLVHNGGPIIMVQVENAAGDRAYVRHLRDVTAQELGTETLLFTTMQTSRSPRPACPDIEGTLTAISVGPGKNVSTALADLRICQPTGPLFISELHVGAYDMWTEPHRIYPLSGVDSSLRTVILAKASVNLYMLHGGTSFGFTSGATFVKRPTAAKPQFTPYTTSSDFDAPLTESGDPTKKLQAIRSAISKWLPGRQLGRAPRKAEKMEMGPIEMEHMFGITGLRQLAMAHSVSSTRPLTFEEVEHAHGLMLYEAKVNFQPGSPFLLSVPGIRDKGYIYINDVFTNSVSRMGDDFEVAVKANMNDVVTVLVEEYGRICTPNGLNDPKGIIGNVTLDHQLLANWTMRPLRLSNATWLRDYDQLLALKRTHSSAKMSPFDVVVYAATFKLQPSKTHDTFLQTDVSVKGIAFLNGFNLGRYWPLAGPQKTLYVPKTLFREENILVLVQLEGSHVGLPYQVFFTKQAELKGEVESRDD